MKKPYINISSRFNPIIYCSKRHGQSSAIIHITDYYTPRPEFFMHTWSKVRGYLHVAFNENKTGEGAYTEEMANQIAFFVKKMAMKNVPTIFIAFAFNDEEKAKSIGYAIVRTFYNTVNTNHNPSHIYTMTKDALEKINVYNLSNNKTNF